MPAPHQILNGAVCNQIVKYQDFGAGVVDR